MSNEEKYWELRFKGLNDQYTQLKTAYADIKEVYSDQFHQIDELQKENKFMKQKMENLETELNLTQEYQSDQLHQMSELQRENLILRKKHDEQETFNKQLKQANLDLEIKNKLLINDNQLLKQKVEELAAKVDKLEKLEIRRSSNSESLNEFARSIFSKIPNMLDSLPLFMPNHGLYDRHLSDIRTTCYSEILTTSGKTPQANPDQSLGDENNELQTFEAFFVLGIAHNKLGKANSSADILFEFQENNCESFNKSILPEFCFPSELKCRPLRESTSEEEMNNILFGQDQDVRNCNSYIFTLNSAKTNEGLIEFVDLPNSDKKIIYCICIQFEDIAIELQTNYEWINTKCLCLISFIPCFELHFKFLRCLLQLKKLRRMETIAEFENIRASLRCVGEEIPPKWEEMLKKYFDYDDLQPCCKVSIEDSLAPCIEYKFPEDLSMIDIPWVLHSIKSSIDGQDFLWLFAALLQERSIVFVSYNLDLLTTCVLAMQALLRPFKWPYFFMPLIPDNLRELLDAPVPILAGIPGSAPDNRKNMPHIIWVLLDEYTPKKRICYSSSMFQEVQELPYSALKQEFLACYSVEGEQAKVAGALKEILKDIIGKFKDKTFASAEEIHKLVCECIPGNEQDFYQALIQTQIFYSAIEESIAW